MIWRGARSLHQPERRPSAGTNANLGIALEASLRPDLTEHGIPGNIQCVNLSG